MENESTTVSPAMHAVFKHRQTGISCAGAGFGCLGFVLLALGVLAYFFWGNKPENVGVLLPLPAVRDTVWVIQKPPTDTVQPPVEKAKPTFQGTARRYFTATKHLAELAPGDRLFLERNHSRAAVFFKNLTETSSDSALAKEAEWRLLLCYLAQCPKRANDFQHLLDKILEEKSHPHFTEAARLKTSVSPLFK